MSGLTVLVFGGFAVLAGFIYQYLGPLVSAKLPPVFTSNQWARAFTTGVFIIATIFIAYFVAKLVGGKKIASRVPVRA